MGRRAFKYRLYPSKSQEQSLFHALTVARHWYNMCVAERKYAYELEGRSIGKNEQLRQVKHYKATFPQAKHIHSHILQVATSDVDKAFQSFFRCVKNGEKADYPRFKSRKRFHSFGLKEYGNSFKLDGRRLKLSFIGRLQVRWHRRIEGKIKTCRIIHKAGKWYVVFACEVEAPTPLPATGRKVGIDRDHNAAINILNKSLARTEPLEVT